MEGFAASDEVAFPADACSEGEMRVIKGFFLLLMAFLGTLFVLENDHDTVFVLIPFWGQANPVSVGVLVVFCFLSGILATLFFILLSKIGSSLKKSFSRQTPQGADHHDEGHHEH